MVETMAIRGGRVVFTGAPRAAMTLRGTSTLVLDQDIMRVPADLILSTNVLATYLGGRAVYQKPHP